MFDQLHDARVRTAAFEWMREQVDRHGDVLQRNHLLRGFEVYGQRVPLVSAAQGIFKPKVLQLPLSIMTTPKGPYDDGFGPDNILQYRYRGTDPSHPDNVGLRNVAKRRLPLIYFHGVVSGKYLSVWPVFVIDEDPAHLSFLVLVDDADHIGLSIDTEASLLEVHEPADEGRRRYLTSLVRRRLHQRAFRGAGAGGVPRAVFVLPIPTR